MSEDEELQAMGLVIQIDEARIREMVHGTLKTRSTPCSEQLTLDFDSK